MHRIGIELPSHQGLPREHQVSLMAVVLFLIIVGVCLALLPMDDTIKRVVVVLVVVIALYWLLAGFGILPAVRFR